MGREFGKGMQDTNFFLNNTENERPSFKMTNQIAEIWPYLSVVLSTKKDNE